MGTEKKKLKQNGGISPLLNKINNFNFKLVMSQSICKYCDGTGHTESKCQLKKHQLRLKEYKGRMAGVVCSNCQLCGHIAKTCQLQLGFAPRQKIHVHLNSLGRLKGKEKAKVFVETDCPVCLEVLQPRTTVVLGCKHMLCKSCKSHVNICPLCRAKI